MSQQRKCVALIGASMMLFPAASFAWNGFDAERGSGIEIAEGTLVAQNRTIEIYDDNSGSYKDIIIRVLNVYPAYTEVWAYDTEMRQFRVFQLESR